jgi:hypothetical protein
MNLIIIVWIVGGNIGLHWKDVLPRTVFASKNGFAPSQTAEIWIQRGLQIVWKL